MKVEILNQTITFQELASKITDTVTELILEGVTLNGDEASAFALNKATRGHGNLEKVSFVDVKSPNAASEINVIVSTLFVSVPNITTVRFEKTKVSPSSISASMYSTSLKDLAVVNNGFTDEDLNSIAVAIAKCQSIEKLDFRGNNASDVGCMAASAVLKKNTSLQVALFDGDKGFTGRSVEANPIAADGNVPRAA